MVAKTQFAITGEDTRYFLNGALFVLKPDEMSLVATDGHRLALVSVTRDGKGEKDADENKAILPKKTLGELGRLLGEGDGDIGYERGENHLFFQVGERMLISRMIDGQFPAYERVIPEGQRQAHRVRARSADQCRQARRAAVERALARGEDSDRKRQGRRDLEQPGSRRGEGNAAGRVQRQRRCRSASTRSMCSISSRRSSTDVVSLELKDEVSQAVMKPVGAEGYDYTYVIMPMRV